MVTTSGTSFPFSSDNFSRRLLLAESPLRALVGVGRDDRNKRVEGSGSLYFRSGRARGDDFVAFNVGATAAAAEDFFAGNGFFVFDDDGDFLLPLGGGDFFLRFDDGGGEGALVEQERFGCLVRAIFIFV